MLREPDIDALALAGMRVAIMGFGNQGRAQALNLRDSGIDLIVGLRDGSPRSQAVEAERIPHAPPSEAAKGADVVMMLVPDELHAAVYRDIEPSLREGAALGFSHGLAIRFGFIVPRGDLDVFMVSPKGPGTALRSLYVDGQGMVALTAVAQDATGKAEAIANAYGAAIGCGRAGLIASTFAEECEADLFNEQAVVWGAVPEILIAGFDTLVEAGIDPRVAYMECVGELKLIAELIEARGIAAMREAISNTAELGAVLGGPKIVDDGVRTRMRAIMQEVRSGQFAAELKDEEAAGYPLLTAARRRARLLAVEKARESLPKA
jgi:ketol-acid reductoisomerase